MMENKNSLKEIEAIIIEKKSNINQPWVEKDNVNQLWVEKGNINQPWVKKGG